MNRIILIIALVLMAGSVGAEPINCIWGPSKPDTPACGDVIFERLDYLAKIVAARHAKDDIRIRALEGVQVLADPLLISEVYRLKARVNALEQEVKKLKKENTIIINCPMEDYDHITITCPKPDKKKGGSK
jgi:hypothetical protein